MTKIAIVSDSTGCIPVEELKEFDIHVNYISIVFGTESYREFKDMSVEQFMERCENYDGLPTTSQPSPGATIELSCDGPLCEHYTAYMQGGLTYEYGKLGILVAIENMLRNEE